MKKSEVDIKKQEIYCSSAYNKYQKYKLWLDVELKLKRHQKIWLWIYYKYIVAKDYYTNPTRILDRAYRKYVKKKR